MTRLWSPPAHRVESAPNPGNSTVSPEFVGFVDADVEPLGAAVLYSLDVVGGVAYGCTVEPDVGSSRLGAVRMTRSPRVRSNFLRSSQIRWRSPLKRRVCSARYLRTSAMIGSFMIHLQGARQVLTVHGANRQRNLIESAKTEQNGDCPRESSSRDCPCFAGSERKPLILLGHWPVNGYVR